MHFKFLLLTAAGFAALLWAPAARAQDVYTRTDLREAIQRVERHGDEFKSEFKKALSSAHLSDREERVKEAAEDLEDEVDNLKKNYNDHKTSEAKENLDNAMLMASPINRFMSRHYFGPESRRAWENLRTDLNVIALGYGVPMLPRLDMGTAAGSSTMPATNSADRMGINPGNRARTRLERDVRHELVMLPYYGVFDRLAFRTDGSTVTLFGEVTRPTLKSSAENVVRDVEGVERVVNQIRVLPLSPNDDQIRLAAYRAIYGNSMLDRYALQAVPPIHIIVENGNVTLDGVVANENDRNVASIQAKSVPGVFSVTNNLRVEQSR